MADFEVKRKGRKFTVVWNSCISQKMHIQFSIIGDCHFLLKFSFPNHLELTKKPVGSNQQQSSISNQELQEVTVSDDTGIKKMPKISANEWGPISVDLMTMAFDGRLSVRVHLDYEPKQPNNNSQVGILDHLTQLLNSGTGSDVEFVVKGEKIGAHTLILRGESPVFTAMFEHDMT